jgi:hypothetical protein
MTTYGLNPDLSREERDVLQRENFAVLMTGQALIGNVTPDMTAVSLHLSSDSLHVRFAVVEHGDETNDAVRDVLSELDTFYAHLADAPRIESEVVVGRSDASWRTPPWRAVYASRPR